MIKRITSCSEWYHVTQGPEGESIVSPVAAWGLNVRGEVIGLLAYTDAFTTERIVRLVTPPPGKGSYLMGDQLNDEQRALAKRR
jgi:hypothetical protein